MCRRACLACGVFVTCLLATAPPAPAQEPPTLDELQKMYDDALAQLKTAQDRKNELGVENEQLQTRLADAQAKLAQSTATVQSLQEQVNRFADDTFNLRSFHAAWLLFIERYPALKLQWQVFLENQWLSVPRQTPSFIDSDWPLSPAGG